MRRRGLLRGRSRIRIGGGWGGGKVRSSIESRKRDGVLTFESSGSMESK